VSDDTSLVHTIVKDSKAIQVRRLSVADLEGSCGDFGTNGLEGCFRPEKSDFQHLIQNGGKINTHIEKLLDDKSQKPMMLSMGKIDLDDLGAAANSKVEIVQGLGFDNQPTYEEQLQSSNTHTPVHLARGSNGTHAKALHMEHPYETEPTTKGTHPISCGLLALFAFPLLSFYKESSCFLKLLLFNLLSNPCFLSPC
jgi:hypothetical protein